MREYIGEIMYLVWKEGVFKKGNPTLESLVSKWEERQDWNIKTDDMNREILDIAKSVLDEGGSHGRS